jgi:hypothetical protein
MKVITKTNINIDKKYIEKMRINAKILGTNWFFFKKEKIFKLILFKNKSEWNISCKIKGKYYLNIYDDHHIKSQKTLKN